MARVALMAAALAGLYGALHDQVTYTLSPEYFTKLKFLQFDYADFGWGDRVFAATIGFLATWWVGFVAGWFLARRLIPGQRRQEALRQIRGGFACVFLFAIGFGLLGYAYGWWRGPEADYSSWESVLRECRIEDRWSFVRVAYIHNAGYLGGAIGLIVALIAIGPGRSPPAAWLRMLAAGR